MWTDVMTGEFLGTTFMILLGGGVVANAMLRGTKGAGSSWLMINAGWGFAVMVGVLVSTSTGSPYGDLNPVATSAKYLLGCFMGAVLVWAAYYPHWEVTRDPLRKRAVFCTDPVAANKAANVISEAIATVVLIFAIGSMVDSALITDQALPYLIRVLVWAVGLSLGGPTGNAMNPARDLAPRIAHRALGVADCRQGQFGLAVCLGADRRSLAGGRAGSCAASGLPLAVEVPQPVIVVSVRCQPTLCHSAGVAGGAGQSRSDQVSPFQAWPR